MALACSSTHGARSSAAEPPSAATACTRNTSLGSVGAASALFRGALLGFAPARGDDIAGAAACYSSNAFWHFW